MLALHRSLSKRLSSNVKNHKEGSSMSHIGKLILSKRKNAGLKSKDLVLLAGYKKISKGMRHLQKLEDGRSLIPKLWLVEKFAKALGIEDVDIKAAFELDWEELNRPTKPHLIEKLHPVVYRSHQLPENCTVEEASKIGSKMAVETGRSFCLILSRVRAVYFYPSGKSIDSSYAPGTSIGRYNAFMKVARRRLKGRL
jgi:hypothetical protein